MRIGIDARFLTHPQMGGFKTYTENLIMAISEIDKENEYVLYLDRQPAPTAPIPRQSNFTTSIITGDRQFYGMAWREQYALPRRIKKDHLDLFHAPCLTAPVVLGLPLVVTIHDMIWYYPDRYSPKRPAFGKRGFMRWYYRTIPRIATLKAQAVITVSGAAKRSILQYMQISDDQIFITHEAANSLYRPLDDHR